MRDVLEQVLEQERFDELAVQRPLASAQAPEPVTVPEVLRSYREERASARDYDRLLPGGAAVCFFPSARLRS